MSKRLPFLIQGNVAGRVGPLILRPLGRVVAWPGDGCRRPLGLGRGRDHRVQGVRLGSCPCDELGETQLVRVGAEAVDVDRSVGHAGAPYPWPQLGPYT